VKKKKKKEKEKKKKQKTQTTPRYLSLPSAPPFAPEPDW
jgi:hypothetical protein